MKIAIAQINPIIGDFSYNFDKIINFADKAKTLSCDLVVFSELVISGYPPRDLLEKNDFIEANLACLNKLLESIHGIGVICGFVDKNPDKEGKSLYNSAALFENGNLLYKVNKRLLPTYDVYDETRYFEPGLLCESYPYKGRRIGLTICEDIWNDKDIIKKRAYSIDPVALMIQDGADLIVNISASPFYAGKNEFRQNMLGSIAGKHSVPLIYANQAGGNDSLLFDGISAAFNQYGKTAARACDFEEDLVVFDSEPDESSESIKDNLHTIADSVEESILKALVMGTRDYVTKCRFSKVVVGLSGGMDSALTAYIAAMALGPENVLTVFMPSQYTSMENYNDSKKLAENIGINLIRIPIDGIFKEFLKHLSPCFKEAKPDITEQNIQARIRGTVLMAISNREKRLLLSTGNKSELSVGYCTLYGDMSGGLAVISDVPKTVVYDLARFINKEKEYIPGRIIDKAPSAELKPDQKDQDDLPPYDILDSILYGYIEEFKGVNELVEMGYERKLVEEIVHKVDQNEYKRRQAAPGLKVTSKAFGDGRRYPLAHRYTERPSDG
ncbi:MAG: NAD+ synthase [Deltaproteobacteria bacterium]|nr:NAD+ synthase [Deltaproteobacteria bacterium]